MHNRAKRWRFKRRYTLHCSKRHGEGSMQMRTGATCLVGGWPRRQRPQPPALVARRSSRQLLIRRRRPRRLVRRFGSLRRLDGLTRRRMLGCSRLDLLRLLDRLRRFRFRSLQLLAFSRWLDLCRLRSTLRATRLLSRLRRLGRLGRFRLRPRWRPWRRLRCRLGCHSRCRGLLKRGCAASLRGVSKRQLLRIGHSVRG